MSYRVVMGFLALGALVFTSAPCAADDVAEVKALHEQAMAAYNARDAAAFMAVFDDQAVTYDVFAPLANDMKLVGKDTAMKNLAAAFANVEQMNAIIVNPQYRIFGNTSIAWGHYRVIAKAKDSPMRVLFMRYTSTSVKSDGKWKAVSHHVSLVPSDSWGN